MEIRSMHFKANAATALANPVLQGNLRTSKGKFVDKRRAAIADFEAEGGDFAALRDAGRDLRNLVLADLDLWLEKFEQSASARGATVLWARDGAEICRHVIDIGRRHGVKKAVKSKSMLSEEAGINQALASSRSRPTSASTFCKSTTMSRHRTSSRRWCTRGSTRSPTCSRKCTGSRARPKFPN